MAVAFLRVLRVSVLRNAFKTSHQPRPKGTNVIGSRAHASAARIRKNMMRRKGDLEFATSLALNDVASKLARQHLPRAANRIFDGGATPFTKRGFRYKRYRKKSLSTFIFIAPIQAEYMRHMILPNTVRRPEGKAIGVPIRSNLPKSFLTRKGNNVSKGSWRKFTDESNPNYFVMRGAKPGLMRVTGKGKRRSVKRVVSYEDSTSYPRVYFPYYRIANRFARRNFNKAMHARYVQKMRPSRLR